MNFKYKIFYNSFGLLPINASVKVMKTFFVNVPEHSSEIRQLFNIWTKIDTGVYNGLIGMILCFTSPVLLFLVLVRIVIVK